MRRRKLAAAAIIALAASMTMGIGLELAGRPPAPAAHRLECPPLGSAWTCGP